MKQSFLSKVFLFFLTAITVASVGYVFHRALNQPEKSYRILCGSSAGPTFGGVYRELRVTDGGVIITDVGSYFPGPYEACDIRVEYLQR